MVDMGYEIWDMRGVWVDEWFVLVCCCCRSIIDRYS